MAAVAAGASSPTHLRRRSFVGSLSRSAARPSFSVCPSSSFSLVRRPALHSEKLVSSRRCRRSGCLLTADRAKSWPVVLAVVAVLGGCREREQIHSYVVARDIEDANAKLAAEWRAKAQAGRDGQNGGAQTAAAAKPGRLLGALLPHNGQTWIFKMLGDEEAVARHVDEVRALVAGVTFDGDKPKWTLPPAWREEANPGSLRYATLFVEEGDPDLELAVSALPGEQSVADNVNRWRGQVQLKPQSAADAEKDAVELKTAAGPARWVDLVGKYVPGAGMAPFARGGAGGPIGAGAMPADHPPIVPPSTANKTSGAGQGAAIPKSPVGYDLPAGWEPSPPTQFSVASFNVADGARQVRVTVSSASGDLLSNVNRWRGQLQVPPLDQSTLDTAVTKMKVDGRDASYIELLGTARGGEQDAIYGVVVADTPQSSWFVKLMGDASLALRERERFQKFVLSLKFPKQ
jgi:hypothetical protein